MSDTVDTRPTICPHTFIPSFEGKRKIEDRSFGRRFDNTRGLQGVYIGMHTHASLMDRLRNHFTHSPDTTVDLVFKDDSGERYRIWLNSKTRVGYGPEYGDGVILIKSSPNIPYELPKKQS
jgi:hypothetical protein